LPGFFPFSGFSSGVGLMLRFNAFIRSKTFPPLGRGLCAIVFPALLIDKVNKRALVMVFEFIPLKMRRLVHNVLRKIEAAGAMGKTPKYAAEPGPNNIDDIFVPTPGNVVTGNTTSVGVVFAYAQGFGFGPN
jgi:hypothetical protein